MDVTLRKPTADEKERSRLTKDEWREYTKTVWQIANVSDSGHPAVFPEEIPRRLIKLFSFVGETVLDPFGGSGTTGRVALSLGRSAVCLDQNPEYVSRMQSDLGALDSEGNFNVRLGDARDMSDIEEASIDLIVTSPPYWNKADYGGNGQNIGAIEGYQQFLREMRKVFESSWTALRPGRKICIVTANVNQHTDHGLLTFPLAADFIDLMRDVGFVMVNEIIWNKDGTGGRWGSSGVQRPIFGSYPFPPNFLFKNVHEYVIIFAKPADKRTTGPKVRPYRELMEYKAMPSGRSDA